MTIYLNNQPIELPSEDITIKDLLEIKNINPQGTAVAIDDHLILKNKWETTPLSDNMRVTIISAAFGG